MFEILNGDGTEFRVAWDGAARAEVLAGLVWLGGLCMGEGVLSLGKCRGSQFHLSCSAGTLLEPPT